jgi:hypothetical protein
MAELPFGFHVVDKAHVVGSDFRTPVFNEAEIHACFDDVGKARAQVTCGYCSAVHRATRVGTLAWFHSHECAAPHLDEHLQSAA